MTLLAAASRADLSVALDFAQANARGVATAIADATTPLERCSAMGGQRSRFDAHCIAPNTSEPDPVRQPFRHGELSACFV
jgi:hypothetical protein